MKSNVPFIPENAPFTSEQRAWLNGFLAGLFSSAPGAEQEATQKQSLRIAVLYASQSGTAEGLARKLAKELKAQGHHPAVSTLVGYSPNALQKEQYALLLTSTYGDGEAPDGVAPFYEELCMQSRPFLEGLSYSVLALGDKHYEHFCKFGKELDTKLASLGAVKLADRMDCDVDTAEPFRTWKTAVLSQLDRIAGGHSTATATEIGLSPETPSLEVANEAIRYSRESPLLAPVVDKRELTSGNKTTLHMAFSIEGSGMTYEAGDAVGVVAHNHPELVAEVLEQLRFHGNEEVEIAPKGKITLHDALTHYLQITRLTKTMLQNVATRGSCKTLLDLCDPARQSDLNAFLYGRGLIDLLIECPGVVDDPADLVTMLPKLAPRLYSISSSPLAHSYQVHTTVAVVRYSAHNRERHGVCSTLFADRTSVSDRLPIYIQPNRRFKLPSNADAPMIMIGPGTGIAPFRGFLHERQVLGHEGKNWLFFGARSAKTDFLYREELEQMQSDGHLTHLDTAFSRDQEEKVYVQDRMLAQSSLFWRWLEEGASVYVCGDASSMAKDVDKALHTIVSKAGGRNEEQAREYVNALKDNQRYLRDVY